MADRAYTIDGSKHNPVTIPWRQFVDGGVFMGIFKSSMGGGYDYRCDAHVASAKDGGADVGLYHWLDPTQNHRQQAIYHVRKIELHKPVCIGYDIEQWWANWQLWYEYTRRERPGNEVPRISAQQWIDCVETFREVMRAETDYEARGKALSYSARWVLNLYPELIPYINDLPQWLAYYIASGSVRSITWDQLHTMPAEGASPGMPPGIISWLLWQISAVLKLPGTDFPLDVNLFNGTVDDYFAWRDDVVVPDPPDPGPDPVTVREVLIATADRILVDPGSWQAALEAMRDSLATAAPAPVGPEYYAVVTASALNIRSGPGTGYGVVGHFTEGDRTGVWETMGNWARVSPEGISEMWTSLSWLRRV
jgi:hypothetical protein